MVWDKIIALLKRFPQVDRVVPIATGVQFSCVMAPITHADGRDERPSMVIDLYNGKVVASCFACKVRGSVESVFYRLAEAMPMQAELCRELVGVCANLPNEYLKAPPPGIYTRDPRETQISIPDHNKFLLEVINTPFSQQAVEFIKSKNVDPKIARSVFGCTFLPRNFKHQILGTHESGEYKVIPTDSVFIPTLISRADGTRQCVGGQRRSVGPSKGPKYVNIPPGPGFHQFMFGEHLLRNAHGKQLAVVEGPFDAMRLYELGLISVALNGVVINPRKIQKIAEAAPSRVLALLDPDKAGRKATKNFIEELNRAGVPVQVPEIKTDPKHLTKDQIERF